MLVFVGAIAFPAWLGLQAGLWHLPGEADADVPLGTGEQGVAALGWPHDARGLATGDGLVVWDHRTGDQRGLWSYEVPSGRARLLLDRRHTGPVNGRLHMDGRLVAWRGRDGLGVEGYDVVTGRRFSLGEAPCIAGPVVSKRTLVWAEVAGDVGSVIRQENVVTGEVSARRVQGEVREVAAWGRTLAWTAAEGDGATQLWLLERRGDGPRALARRAAHLTAGGDAVAWSRPAKGGSVIELWDCREHRRRTVCRTSARVSGLAVSDALVAWSQGDEGDLWCCARDSGAPQALCELDGAQVAPAILGDAVLWADRRDGTWQLYRAEAAR